MLSDNTFPMLIAIIGATAANAPAGIYSYFQSREGSLTTPVFFHLLAGGGTAAVHAVSLKLHCFGAYMHAIF